MTPSEAVVPIDPPHPLRTLAIRITVWYVVVFLGSLAALIAFAAPAVRGALDDENRGMVEHHLDRHAQMIQRVGLPAYTEAVERSELLFSPSLSIRISEPEGRVVYQHGDFARASVRSERAVDHLRLEIGATDAPWQAVAARLRARALALALGALVLSVAGGYYLTRRGLRPVRELASTARELLRSGDLSRRVPVRGTADELDDFSALFNRMLDRNQQLVRGMREALDNVAHDLRTPLTRLRLTSEDALRHGDTATTQEALVVAMEESERVLVMLRALMDISEAETGIMRLDRARVSLNQLASDVAELYAHVAEDAGVQLDVIAATAVSAYADPSRLRQAIANLVDNAIKYTPSGGRVEIEIARDADHAIVRVRDTGEGIPASSIPRIWERLYRADPSRSKRGLGLGLSFVQAIVAAHGGSVTVASQLGRGSTFTISMPLVPREPVAIAGT
ncbi:MAG: sensor histidine kinase [Kofleriaceae bacterium]